MADYRAIKGLNIQTVSSDPSNLVAGDIWYNSTLGKLRGAKIVGAWSSGGNINDERQEGGGNGASQTAAWIAAGYLADTNLSLDNEHYDGTSWTEQGNINTGRKTPSGLGTTTASLVAGGEGDLAISEEFNEFKYSQNVTNLYPELDKDNPDDNPGPIKSFLKGKIIYI